MCDINQQVLELCFKHDNIRLTSNNIDEFIIFTWCENYNWMSAFISLILL